MAIPLTLSIADMPDYNPEKLFSFLMQREGLAHDAAFARYLHISPPVIAKVRNRSMVLSDTLLIRMHEVSGLSIADLKARAGMPIHTYPRAVQTVDGRLSRWGHSRRRSLGLTV